MNRMVKAKINLLADSWVFPLSSGEREKEILKILLILSNLLFSEFSFHLNAG